MSSSESGSVSDSSDSSNHHCVDCGERWWTSKGLSCEVCDNYWCPDWTHTFVFFYDCESEDERDTWPEQSCCAECFLNNEDWHCNDSTCHCQLKKDVVQKMWDDWISSPHMCGQVDLVKNGEETVIMVSNFKDTSKFQWSENKNNLFFKSTHRCCCQVGERKS
jgi:hypothetical protein